MCMADENRVGSIKHCQLTDKQGYHFVLISKKPACFWVACSKIAVRRLSVKTGVRSRWPTTWNFGSGEKIQNVASRVKFVGLEWQTYYLYIKKIVIRNKVHTRKFGKKVALKVLMNKRRKAFALNCVTKPQIYGENRTFPLRSYFLF